MRLAELSSDIMRLVTDWAGGKSSIHLWCSGDVQLRLVLGSYGGVGTMDLLDSFPLSKSRWPMMLRELRGLEILFIDRSDKPLYGADVAIQQLQHLPNLRVLHIFALNASTIIDGVRKVQNFKNFFPQLREFRVTSLQGTWSALDLPSTLTHLSFIRLDPAYKWIGGPYEALQTFETWSPTGSLFLDFLPKSLSTLQLYDVSPLKMPLIPPNLTSLAVSLRQWYTKEVSLDWPLSLTHLDIGFLQYLRITDLNFRQLRNLRFLSFHLDKGWTDAVAAKMPIFPVSLTELRASFPMGLTPIVLPPHLENLNVNWPDFSASLALAEFSPLSDPSGFSDLASARCPVHPNLVPGTLVLPGFPKTLKHLVLSRRSKESESIYSWVSDLPHSHLREFQVPEFHLNALSWPFFAYPWPVLEILYLCVDLDFLAPLCALPLPSLKSLKLSIKECQTMMKFHIWALPRGLKSLSLFFRYGSFLSDTNSLEALPLLLEDLLITHKEGPKIELDSRDFEALAKLTSLRSLSMDCTLLPTVMPRHFQCLPRTLTSLTIQGGAQPVSGLAFQYLPPSITSLRLPQTTYLPEHLMMLPRTNVQVFMPQDALHELPAMFGLPDDFEPLLDRFPDPRTDGSIHKLIHPRQQRGIVSHIIWYLAKLPYLGFLLLSILLAQWLLFK